MEGELTPFHNLPSGLCEDVAGEALALIQRMARGDGGGLAELYAMWSPVLLGCACRMLGDRREADEVLHETFERIWKGAPDYTPHQSPPFVWAFVILRGLAMRRLRRRRSRKRNFSRHSEAVSNQRAGHLKVLAADDCRRLYAAMEQLDLEERSCLESAVFLGYARSGEEEHSGTALANAKNRLRKALETLRHLLSRHEL